MQGAFGKGLGPCKKSGWDKALWASAEQSSQLRPDCDFDENSAAAFMLSRPDEFGSVLTYAGD